MAERLKRFQNITFRSQEMFYLDLETKRTVLDKAEGEVFVLREEKISDFVTSVESRLGAVNTGCF